MFCLSQLLILLKVSKSRKQFMVSWILPKNKRKQFDLKYHSSRKVEFFHSFFFGVSKNCFRYLLTFNKAKIPKEQTQNKRLLQNSLPAIPAHVWRAIDPEQFLDQHSCLDLSWNPLRCRLTLLEETHLEIRTCLFTLDYLINNLLGY